jgi:hypothetical protein
MALCKNNYNLHPTVCLLPISPFIYLPIYIKIIKSITMRWMGYLECMREKENLYTILVGKPKGKGPLGILRRRWEVSIELRVYFRNMI